jgi:hypothetical protein
MKARQLVASAAYTPDQLRVIGKAFENAWEQVAPLVSKRPAAIEAARLKLAEIVLSLAKDGSRDAQQLEDAAVKKMLASPTKL